MAAIAVLPARSCWSPESGAASTIDDSHATLSSGFTSVNQTTVRPAASMSQSGVKVRTRPTVPASSRASTMNSDAGSSAMREPRPFSELPAGTELPVLIVTPLPLSRRHTPQQVSARSAIESKQHICRGPATIGTR